MTSSFWQVVIRRMGYAGLLASLLAFVGCGGSGNGFSGPGLGPGVNNAMLQGQYAFSFAGQSRTTGAPIMGAGTFTADGNGGITGGIQDVNATLGGHTYSFTGKYSIGTDLRGTAVLSGLPICPNWQFTMLNSSHALLTCFDSANTASGSIDIQDPTAFTNAKLTGNYVFGISGLGAGGSAAAIAGDWTMDGQGTITGGELDVNDTGSTLQDTPLTGTYSVGSNGRGTLTLNSNAYGTQNFVLYVVNDRDLKLVETDPLSASTPVLSGEVLQQAAGPFTLASLNGGHAFTLGGVDLSFFVATGTGGVFTADGNGNLSGVLDDNLGGSTSLGVPFVGTYSMGANGRALLTFSFLQLAAYPAANGTWQLVELDANGVSAGMAKIQSGGPFTVASTSGTFAMNWTGILNPQSSSPSQEDVIGQLTADGNGNLGGTLDINSFANIIQGLPLTASSYTMTGNGHGTASVNTNAASFNMQTYQVDQNTVLFLDIDSSRVLVGLMQKQQ